MAWLLDYQFLELTHDQKTLRRESLDRWGALAHFSSLLPLAALLFLRLVAYLVSLLSSSSSSPLGAASTTAYQEVPHSPELKGRRLSKAGGIAAAWRRVCWWLGGDVTLPGRGRGRASWGTRWVWVVSLLWLAWLLVLCVLDTGNDYLHLTKRLGHVAMSQMPLHYLLSLKALSPAALALSSSHEAVNKWHRALGRIVALLLAAHSALYLNFFVRTGVLAEKLGRPVVIFGILGMTAVGALYATALTPLRARSYRLFFITHLVVAFILPVLVWLHVHHAWGVRLYVTEALLGLLADLIFRKITTTTVQARVEAIPGTDLIRITAPLPAHKAAPYAARPGSHVYVNIPPEARPTSNPLHPSSLPYTFSYNPFTVAAVDKARSITFVARRQRGLVTRNLARYADAGVDLDMPLCIEGPYGAAGRHFAELVGPDVDRVLLVAGGVGATFAAPIYRALSAATPSPSRVSFVWAVRAAGDVSWASGTSGRKLVDEPNVHVFVTADASADPDEGISSGGGGVRGDYEAGSLLAGDAVEMMALESAAAQVTRRRPNWARIVDDVFRLGGEERVAVLVCGPQGMARDVRREVGRWVSKGRIVSWHDESFALG